MSAGNPENVKLCEVCCFVAYLSFECHVLSWPKLGLEPKFHESGTFGGFGKRAQSLSRIFNTGPYGESKCF